MDCKKCHFCNARLNKPPFWLENNHVFCNLTCSNRNDLRLSTLKVETSEVIEEVLVVAKYRGILSESQTVELIRHFNENFNGIKNILEKQKC